MQELFRLDPTWIINQNNFELEIMSLKIYDHAYYILFNLKAKEIEIKAFVMKPLVVRNLAETVRKVLDEK